MNVAVALSCGAEALAKGFGTVSLCLSKGLGAPVGSVLAGSRDLIRAARRLRRMLSGGMRQTGSLAAAGIHALEYNVARLADNHTRAARLAEVLAAFPELGPEPAQINMVFMTQAATKVEAVRRFLADRGIAVGGRYGSLGWVTHLDIDDASVDRVRGACDHYFSVMGLLSPATKEA